MDINEALRIRGVGVGKKLKGDATANDVRVGKTFSNAASNENEGALPVRSLVAQAITPTTVDQTKQAGIYDGDITVKGDANLVAANIASGKSIFGIAGTFAARRFAIGTASNTTGTITVTGLAFSPKLIIVTADNTSLPRTTVTMHADPTTYPNAFIAKMNNASMWTGDANSNKIVPYTFTIYPDGFSVPVGEASSSECRYICFE